MIKEVFVHEGMIPLRVFLWQANIFIHVKGHDVFEANLACFMHSDKVFVSFKRGTTGRKTENERALSSGFEGIDALNDMARSPFADFSGGI